MADVTQSVINIDTNLADVANQVKSLESNLSGLYKKFVDIADVIDKIEQKAGKANNTVVNLNSSVNTVVGKGGSISGSPRSKQYKAMADAVIDDTKAQTGYTKAQTDLINEQVKNFGQTLVNMTTKINAYAESVSKQVDKATKTAHMQADTELKKAAAYYKTIQAQVLQNSGQSRFTGGLSGGLAYGLSGMSQRFRGRQGLVGLVSRVGERLGENQNSWFGKTFGKGGKINNVFGGLLAKGTVDGLGINAGAVALGGFVTVVGTAGAAVKKFADQSLDAYGSMQKLSTNLEVVYGSRTQSNQAFSQIQQYATKSPFGVAQTTEMAVLLKQSGVYASELQDTLEMIGDVSSGNEEKMKRIANNYAQIQAIGHASMLDMRQFAYAGLPIYEEVAKYMKVSQTELRSMISDGKVTSEVIEQVFKNMTGEGGTFYKAVNKGAKTMAARNVNLEDIRNIALSNWGQAIWNMGGTNGSDSLLQNLLGFKESFWEGIGKIGKSWATGQQYDYAMGSQIYLNDLKEAYKKALAENNKPMATELAKQINEFRSNISSEDEIRAGLANSARKRLGIDGKNVIDDDEYQRTVERLSDLLRRFGTVNQGQGVYENLTEKEIRQVIQQGNLGRIDFGENSGAKATAHKLVDSLKDAVPESKFYTALMKLASSAEHADEALALMESNIEARAIKAEDSINKIARGSNSLLSLTEKYNERWAQSEEGKKQAALKDQTDYESYKALFKEMAGIYDAKSNRIDVSKLESVEQLDKFYSAGFAQGERLRLSPEYLDKGTLYGNRFNIWRDLEGNITNVLQQFDFIGLQNNGRGKELYNAVKDIRSNLFGKNRTGWAYQENGSKKLTEALQNVEMLANGQGYRVENIINGMYTRYSGTSNLAKYAQDGKLGDLLVPLWKRIFASATGWDATQINTNGAGAMQKYQAQQRRQIVAGGIRGMTAAGLSARQIADSLVYEQGKNSQGERQVDWKRTQDEMIRYAMSMKGSVKETSTVLSSLADSMRSQLSVYDQLKNTMWTVGEDWSNISKFTLQEKTYLENAYAGGKGADFAKSGESTFGVRYDREKGFVLNDDFFERAGLNGKTIEELKKAVDDGTVTDEKMRAVIAGLVISTDSIIDSLDKNREALSTLTEAVDLASDISNESLGFYNLGRQARGEAFGKSAAALQTLRGTLGGNFLLNDQTGNGLSESLGKVFSRLATMNISRGYEDYAAGNKDALSRSQYTNMVEVAKRFQQAESLAEQVEIARTLFTDFNDVFRSLISEAERATEAQEQAQYLTAASDFLRNNYTSLADYGNRNAFIQSGNSLGQQNLMNSLGIGGMNFSKWSNAVSAQVIANPFENSDLFTKYYNESMKLATNQDETNRLQVALGSGDIEEVRSVVKELGGDFDSITESINQSNAAIGDMGERLMDLGANIGNVLEQFAGQAVSSTFETWGEALATGADASESLMENFRQLGAGLLKNLGTMITEAGLSMAIHASSMPEVLAGLALAAAGGGVSLLGGMLGANKESEDNDDDDEYQKLLRIKEDLSDLLKQAREDAIYYESTVRHRNALSTNGQIGEKTTKVNDAIITPSGDVISTHPDDYLIATKTPQTFMGGGTPTIKFSVIDKSTGIKVTQQKSSYDEDRNEIDFEAVIESKISEFITSTKGDEAFSMREARLRGNSYVG